MQQDNKNEGEREEECERRRQPEKLGISEGVESIGEVANSLVATSPDKSGCNCGRALEQIKASQCDNERLDFRQVNKRRIEQATDAARCECQSNRQR